MSSSKESEADLNSSSSTTTGTTFPSRSATIESSSSQLSQSGSGYIPSNDNGVNFNDQTQSQIGTEGRRGSSISMDPSANSSSLINPPPSNLNNSGSRRQDMDRIKSRAADSGWNWEAEREKIESQSINHPSNSNSTTTTTTTTTNPISTNNPDHQRGSLDADRRYQQFSSSPSKMSSSSSTSSSNLHHHQNPVNPNRQLPPRIDTRSNSNYNNNNNRLMGNQSRQNSFDNQSQPIQSSYPRSNSASTSNSPTSAGNPTNGLPGSYAFNGGGGIGMSSSNSNQGSGFESTPTTTNTNSGEITSAGGSGGDSALATPGHQTFPEPTPNKSQVSNSTSTTTGGSGSTVTTKKEGSGSGTSGSRRRDQACAACQKPMTGQFVRALGAVYHLDCFRCRDCNKVVAGKFFPATDDMIDSSPSGSAISSSSADRDKERETEKQLEKPSGSSKLFPLCETDYFRRLDLLCAKCGGALRGSYITALGMKFHVEHFTCSICPTVFGPQDSYYEHDGRVFCHFHYSTRFAIRCTGCRTAILKQFVEINRNNKDEHWHPECYMIHKFWNIKLHPTGSTPKEGVGAEPTMATETPEPSNSGIAPVTNASATDAPSAEALETEANETPSSLKQKQKQTEEQVYRIWTVLSAFEESSAACISEMLRHVSSGRYLNGVRMAERFILHVEILFASIDDLEAEFRKEGAKGISHIREARMLCKKIVNFFSLLSHTQETGARRMGITQELLSLVTGLAHYLKILIRIALTGALKLDREYGNRAAIGAFLTSLAALAREASNSIEDATSPTSNSASSESNHDANGSHTNHLSTSVPAYGYQSLPRSTGTGSSSSTSQSTLVDPSSTSSEIQVIGGESATDLCVSCGQTVEEECVRMGINLRWHTSCLKCTRCKRPAARDPNSTSKKSKASAPPVGETEDENIPPALPPTQFSLEVTRRQQDPNNGSTISGHGSRHAQNIISPFCPDCSTSIAKLGFQTVTRLEQYAFLLRVALIRLLALLKKRGVVPASPPAQTSGLPSGSSQSTLPSSSTGGQGRDKDLPQREGDEDQPIHEAYRDSQDIKRMKSVNLDRKLSTKARVPRISTVVGSPSGQVTHPGSGDPSKASPTGTTGNNNVPSSGSDLKRSPRQTAGSSSPRQPSPADRDGRYASPVRRGSRDLSPNRIPQSSIHQQQQMQRGPSPLPGEAGSIVPIRPAFARHNTDVRIRDDGPIRQMSNDDSPAGAVAQQMLEGEEGITLADIPQLLEAEQAREQHRSLPNEGSRCISELSALELFIVKHMAVMTLQQSALKDMVPLDDLIEFIETRKNTFWGKLFKGGKDDKKMKKKGVFGIPLDILIERNGADSTLGASATHLRVPSFIDDIISEMKQMDVSIEGIFRKNGNIRRLKDLSEALDRDPTAVNLGDDNPVQLAALLKKFLRELPDPLMTFKLHRLFVMSQKIEDEAERIRILHMVSILLPKGHRDTMEVLFVFLKWVASFSHIDEETGSKMDLQNLATVLAPNILYSKGSDPAKDETFLANRAILCLLENQDDFWTVPAELAAVLYDRELLSSSAELTSRDILKRCEKYAKGHQKGGMKGGGRTQWASDSSYGEVANRHPDMQPPATMRYVENKNNHNFHHHQQQNQNHNGHQTPRSGYARSPIESENRHPPWGPSSPPPPPSHNAFNQGQNQQSGNASPHSQNFGSHFPPRGVHTPQRAGTPNQDPHLQQQQQQDQQQRNHHHLVEQRSN